MTKHSRQTVAIIGAGLAGLSCATRLRATGISVRVFDKSRGVGGRVASRRADRGMVFDHGAQYFTVKDALFRQQVERWAEARIVAPWEGRIGVLESGRWSSTESEIQRFVGIPTMTAIPKRMAADLQLSLGTRVANISRTSEGWQLECDSGRNLGQFETVIVTAPAAQTSSLLSEFPTLATAIRAVEMAPCWALMVGFDSKLPLPWDAAFVKESPLSWIARNSSKPGRVGHPDCWVLHASPEWSRSHIEDFPDAVTTDLLAAFSAATGSEFGSPLLANAHRWRFALPEQALPDRCIYDADLRLGVCGDWCGGPRVEGAYLSGLALADTIENSQ